jgi:hypothetical protein
MTDDIKETIRRLRALATRADSIGRAIEQHRRNATPAEYAGVLHRLAISAREFHQQVTAATSFK